MLSEVKTKAEMIGVSAESAERFYYHHEGNNPWVNQPGQLINWGEKVMSKSPVSDKAIQPSKRNWDKPRIEDSLSLFIPSAVTGKVENFSMVLEHQADYFHGIP